MPATLSTQQVMMDRSSVEEHKKAFERYFKDKVERAGKRYSGHECDSLYFGRDCMSLMVSMRMNLHISMQTTTFPIAMNNIIKKVSGTPGNGTGEAQGTTIKDISFFWEGGERTVDILPKKYDINSESYTVYDTNVSRPNSVHSFVNSLETGASTQLSTQTLKHLITDRMGTSDSGSILGINLYLWLQKCIMLYTFEGSEVTASEIECEVLRTSNMTLLTGCSNCESMINIDKFTPDELMVLMIGLEGHEAVRINNREKIDIFSSIVLPNSEYMLMTDEGDSRQVRITFNAFPPERALRLAYMVAAKLGVIRDFLEAPSKVRGFAYFNKLTYEAEVGVRGDHESFVMDITRDRLYGTVFKGLTNPTMNDEVDSTNLASSFAALLLECLEGYNLMNNVHYVVEMLGMCNDKLFTNNNIKKDELFKSTMYEHGFLERSENNAMYECIMSNRKEMKILTNYEFFYSTVCDYANGMTSGSILGEKNPTWMQLSMVYGSVMERNSSNVSCMACEISEKCVGSMVTDNSKHNRVNEWLCINQIGERKLINGGCNSVSNDALSHVSNDMYDSTKLLDGIYVNTQITFVMETSSYSFRAGGGSMRKADLYYKTDYLSGGDIGLAGTDDIIRVEDINIGGPVSRHIQNEDNEDNNRIMSFIKDYEQLKKDNERDKNNSDVLRARISDSTRNLTGHTDISSKPNYESVDANSDDGSASLSKMLAKAGGVERIRSMEHKKISDEVANDMNSISNEVMRGLIVDAAVDAENDIISNQFKEERVRYTVIDEPPSGDCLTNTLTDFYTDIGKLKEATELYKKVPWKMGVGIWRTDNQAIAFNRMMGCNTMIFDDENKQINRDVVSDSAPTCNIRYRGNHYDYLQEDENGNYEIKAKSFFESTNSLSGITRLLGERLCSNYEKRRVRSSIVASSGSKKHNKNRDEVNLVITKYDGKLPILKENNRKERLVDLISMDRKCFSEL